MESLDDHSLTELESKRETVGLSIDEQIFLLADIILEQLLNEIIKTEQETDYALGSDIS